MRPASKARIVQLSRTGLVSPFHARRYKKGHRMTDYMAWEAAREPYRVQYEVGAEPYFIARWDAMPWCVPCGRMHARARVCVREVLRLHGR